MVPKQEHMIDSEDCWCRPEVEVQPNGGKVIVHNVHRFEQAITSEPKTNSEQDSELLTMSDLERRERKAQAAQQLAEALRLVLDKHWHTTECRGDNVDCKQAQVALENWKKVS